MDIRQEREKALGIIEEYDRIQDLIGDEYPTYESYVDLNGGPNVLTVLQAKDTLVFLDKVKTMSDDELQRIKDIPTYQDDMREVKDIKDKYEFTWSQMKLLRGGVIRETMTAKDIRALSGLNKTNFCKKYEIPARTWDSWESGERQPAPYILKLLERVVKEDKR